MDKLHLIKTYIDEAMVAAHKGFRKHAEIQARLWFCKCVKPKRKLRKRSMKRKKVTVIFHSLYDGKDYKFNKRGKRK